MRQLQIEEKHPLETIGISFDFTEVLAAADDQMAAWDVAADTGIVIAGAAELNNTVSFLVSGGENKRSYRGAVDVRGTSGEVIRQEFLIRVRGEAVTGPSFTGTPVYITIYVQPGYYAPGYFQDGSV